MRKKFILITGCSSGIGYSTSKYLKQNNFNVIVSCRKIKDVNKLSEDFEYSIQLDLGSTRSIKSACSLIKKIIKKQNLYGIFCNSGYGLYGALEDLNRNQIRQQFEINLFGHIELINYLIPIMRLKNEGRIIFNSSVLGLVSLPYTSAYNATKFAMEAFAKSLRIELSNTNIKVSLIEPGPIESSFNINALKYLKKINYNKSFHKDKYNKMIKLLTIGKSKYTLPAKSVAIKVYKALISKNPKTQYYVTFPTYVMAYASILPNFLFEKLVRYINKQRI